MRFFVQKHFISDVCMCVLFFFPRRKFDAQVLNGFRTGLSASVFRGCLFVFYVGGEFH